MPLFPERRTAKLTVPQATDVILHCKHPDQDQGYADRYGVTRSCITQYRTGHTGGWLRILLRTGWRP